MNRISHLMEARHHLIEAGGCGLELVRIERLIKDILYKDVDDCIGIELIDKLDDDQLRTAIRIKDERIGLFCGPHIEPFVFNYIRKNRPLAATAFHLRE